jgi:large subunit ribosomal protein L22
VDNLYVKLAVANDGPRMKRIRPAPMGRAYRYQRRLTHIVLSVAERQATAGLVTKAEEPVAGTADAPAAKKAAKTGKAKAAAKPKAAPKAEAKKAAAKKSAPKKSAKKDEK